MLCEKCGKNPATTHLKQVINGKASELHLCSQCAQELGYNNIFQHFNPFDDIDFNIGNFLGSLFSQYKPTTQTLTPQRCEFCGTTFEELAETAKAGCSHCYQAFYNQLLPSIQRIHGKTRHVGKVPSSASVNLKLRRELDGLKQQLDSAVNAQEYEKAAELRDKIKDIEKKVQG